VQFRNPVRAGDLLEITAELVNVGSRSRVLQFTATVVGRGAPGTGASAARILPEPVVATTATGTCVVPA
jgi:3-aminobutyryl-CoA ammonia-lyase